MEKNVCLECGDTGVQSDLVPCSNCRIHAVHRYCPTEFPKPKRGSVHWLNGCKNDDKATNSSPETKNQSRKRENRGIAQIRPQLPKNDDELSNQSKNSSSETNQNLGMSPVRKSSVSKQIDSQFVESDEELSNQLKTKKMKSSSKTKQHQRRLESFSSCEKLNLAEPLIRSEWTGSFHIRYMHDKSIHRSSDNFTAFLSNGACEKAKEEVGRFGEAVRLDMVPKDLVWPTSFNETEPKDGVIDVYFFPSTRKYEKDYDYLVFEMVRDDLAMRAVLEDAELLVFTSVELPPHLRRFQGNMYLWGVLRQKQGNDEHGIINKMNRQQHKKQKNIPESSAVGRDRRVTDRGLTASTRRAHAAAAVRDPISDVRDPISYVPHDSTYSLDFMSPPRRSVPGNAKSLMSHVAAAGMSLDRTGMDDYFSGEDDYDEDDMMDRGDPSARCDYGVGSSHAGSSHVYASPVDDEEEIVDDDGGPVLPDLIPSYITHVSHFIWKGEDRGILLCHSRYGPMKDWELHRRDALELVQMTGLSHLRDCIYEYLDDPLLTAFIERWRPETSSFHFGFGEMTITLHDVWYLLQIPVVGRAVIPECEGDPDRVSTALSIALNLNPHQVKDPNLLGWKYAKIGINPLKNYLNRDEVNASTIAVGYLLRLLGGTLFADKSKTHLQGSFVQCLLDLNGVGQYAWGAAALANLYREIGLASDHKCKQVAGFLTLLQAWIYAYFPYYRPKPNSDWRPSDPHACRWIPTKVRGDGLKALTKHRQYLDFISVTDVSWTPFITDPTSTVPISPFVGIIHCRSINEPYMADRVVRQFGYVQKIPSPPIQPVMKVSGRKGCQHASVRFFERQWRLHALHLAEEWQRAYSPGQCTVDYLAWFLPRTHPRILKEDVMVDQRPVAPRPPVDFEAVYYQLASMTEPYHKDFRTEDLDYEELCTMLDRVTIALQDGMPRRAPRPGPRISRGGASGSGASGRGIGTRGRGRD